jgi:hypothetical protein
VFGQEVHPTPGSGQPRPAAAITLTQAPQLLSAHNPQPPSGSEPSGLPFEDYHPAIEHVDQWASPAALSPVVMRGSRQPQPELPIHGVLAPTGAGEGRYPHGFVLKGELHPPPPVFQPVDWLGTAPGQTSPLQSVHSAIAQPVSWGDTGPAPPHPPDYTLHPNSAPWQGEMRTFIKSSGEVVNAIVPVSTPTGDNVYLHHHDPQQTERQMIPTMSPICETDSGVSQYVPTSVEVEDEQSNIAFNFSRVHPTRFAVPVKQKVYTFQPPSGVPEKYLMDDSIVFKTRRVSLDGWEVSGPGGERKLSLPN